MAKHPHHRAARLCVPHIHVGSSRAGMSNTSMDAVLGERRSWGFNQQQMAIETGDFSREKWWIFPKMVDCSIKNGDFFPKNGGFFKKWWIVPKMVDCSIKDGDFTMKNCDFNYSYMLVYLVMTNSLRHRTWDSRNSGFTMIYPLIAWWIFP